MTVQALHQLFAGLVISKITYALPAFAGQLTADDRNRINAISRKALRRGDTHTAFILRKSLIVLSANFYQAHLVIVYTMYSLLKHLHAVLTVSEKDNIITSSLILNSCSIKMVILTYVFLSIDDYTLYVLYYIVMFFNLFLCFPLSLCNSIYLTCWIKRLFDLTWLSSHLILPRQHLCNGLACPADYSIFCTGLVLATCG